MLLFLTIVFLIKALSLYLLGQSRLGFFFFFFSFPFVMPSLESFFNHFMMRLIVIFFPAFMFFNLNPAVCSSNALCCFYNFLVGWSSGQLKKYKKMKKDYFTTMKGEGWKR